MYTATGWEFHRITDFQVEDCSLEKITSFIEFARVIVLDILLNLCEISKFYLSFDSMKFGSVLEIL